MIPTADYASMRKSQVKQTFTEEDQKELDLIDELDTLQPTVMPVRLTDEHREYLNTRRIEVSVAHQAIVECLHPMSKSNMDDDKHLEYRFRFQNPAGAYVDIKRACTTKSEHLVLQRMQNRAKVLKGSLHDLTFEQSHCMVFAGFNSETGVCLEPLTFTKCTFNSLEFRISLDRPTFIDCTFNDCHFDPKIVAKFTHCRQYMDGDFLKDLHWPMYVSVNNTVYGSRVAWETKGM